MFGEAHRTSQIPPTRERARLRAGHRKPSRPSRQRSPATPVPPSGASLRSAGGSTPPARRARAGGAAAGRPGALRPAKPRALPGWGPEAGSKEGTEGSDPVSRFLNTIGPKNVYSETTPPPALLFLSHGVMLGMALGQGCLDIALGLNFLNPP